MESTQKRPGSKFVVSGAAMREQWATRSYCLVASTTLEGWQAEKCLLQLKLQLYKSDLRFCSFLQKKEKNFSLVQMGQTKTQAN